MCVTCGCSAHDDDAVHHHDHADARLLRLEHDLLSVNRAHAATNRRRFETGDVLALNLISAPGAGKTTLLERTIPELRAHREVVVIEGDQQTRRDADRI